MRLFEVKKETERALLVGVQLRDTDNLSFAESLLELEELARSADARVVGTITQKRGVPDVRCFIGSGKIIELKEKIASASANLVIFDESLSPAQTKNLEEALNTKVIDRSSLILDIFARHARTGEAKVQVELAQLQYLLPRLTRMWTHFSRHAGGIGTRGPGETQLESDRRQVKTKISHLKVKLEKIRKQRETQRKQRLDLFRIAVVGYTNAGKSTLFNQLTKSGVWTEDKLFCTLDAVTRYLPLLDGRRIVVSDTVGFIRKLPHELVASFASTLEEVKYADLLLEIVDVSHNDSVEQYRKTNEVLEQIDAALVPRFLILNKADLLEAEEKTIVDPDFDPQRTFLISAKTGQGLEKLLNYLKDYVEKEIRTRGSWQKATLGYGQARNIDS